MENSFGFNVILHLSYEKNPRIVYNVTEIHYRFEGSNEIAVESDIHSCGQCIKLEYLLEMEVIPAIKLHDRRGEVYIPEKEIEETY
jgi:hypothetical protein